MGGRRTFRADTPIPHWEATELVGNDFLDARGRLVTDVSAQEAALLARPIELHGYGDQGRPSQLEKAAVDGILRKALISFMLWNVVAAVVIVNLWHQSSYGNPAGIEATALVAIAAFVTSVIVCSWVMFGKEYSVGVSPVDPRQRLRFDSLVVPRWRIKTALDECVDTILRAREAEGRADRGPAKNG